MNVAEPDVKVRHSEAIAILVARVVYLAGGYVLVVGLARLLSREEFGRYTIVFGVVNVLMMAAITGSQQSVSRYVAKARERMNAIRARAFRHQVLFVGIFGGGVFLGAPFLSNWLNDPDLSSTFRLAVVPLGLYAFYAINLGYLNGARRFMRQSVLDVVMMSSKVALVLLAAYFGHDVFDVVGGLACAAVVSLVASFALTGFGLDRGSDAEIGAVEFARLAVSLVGVALLLNCILHADLLILKRLSPVDTADLEAGLYGAAQQLARIPYFIVNTVGVVLFPLVASGERDRAETASKALVGILALLAGMVSVSIPIASRIVVVIFPETYIGAGQPLAWLVFAMAMMTLLNVSVTIISGAGRPTVSATCLALTLVVQAVATSLLVPKFGMSGAAMGTAIATSAGALTAGIWLWRWFEVRVSARALGRIGTAASLFVFLSVAVARFAPTTSRLVTLCYCAAAYGAYLGLVAKLFGLRMDTLRTLRGRALRPPPLVDTMRGQR